MKTNPDPIAEADVYIAYGRSAQAVEILQQGIKDHPARAAEFQARLLLIGQAPSTEIVRGKMPKIIWIPIAASIINFIGIAMLDWPIWPGLVLLIGIIFGVAWHLIARQNSSRLC